MPSNGTVRHFRLPCRIGSPMLSANPCFSRVRCVRRGKHCLSTLRTAVSAFRLVIGLFAFLPVIWSSRPGLPSSSTTGPSPHGSRLRNADVPSTLVCGDSTDSPSQPHRRAVVRTAARSLLSAGNQLPAKAGAAIRSGPVGCASHPRGCFSASSLSKALFGKRADSLRGVFEEGENALKDSAMEDSIRRVFSHQRPLCPRCKIRASVFRIQPRADGSEVWSFECPGCCDIFTEVTGELVGVSAR
jgi:hypothetical protein